MRDINPRTVRFELQKGCKPLVRLLVGRIILHKVCKVVHAARLGLELVFNLLSSDGRPGLALRECENV